MTVEQRSSEIIDGDTDHSAKLTQPRHGQHAVEPSIGSLVADAHASFSALLHGEIELAKLEVKQSLKFGGVGAALFAVAGVMLLLALPFLFVALAEGLVAAHIWRWAAYLIVFFLFVLLAGLLAFIGFRKVRKVRAPKETIDSLNSTVAALRTVGQSKD